MTTRHRLNKVGHRQADAAFYRTIIVGLHHYGPTKAFFAHRTAEGKTQ